jgi:hypothetical protein
MVTRSRVIQNCSKSRGRTFGMCAGNRTHHVIVAEQPLCGGVGWHANPRLEGRGYDNIR